jgi:hypothetical protein
MASRNSVEKIYNELFFLLLWKVQIYVSNDSTGGYANAIVVDASTGGYANAIATDADVDTIAGKYAEAIVTSRIIIATAVAAGVARETFFVPVSYSFVDGSD